MRLTNIIRLYIILKKYQRKEKIVLKNTINLKMKNKKLRIIICLAMILILAIGIIVFIAIKNNNNKNAGKEEYQEKPDMVIKSTGENPIKLEGFEVTNIDIFKTTETSLEVKATVVNKSDTPVYGFFIEIGLYDEKGKKVTEIAENHAEEIKPGDSYVLESSVVGLKKAKEITSAKLLKLEKEITSNMEEAFDTNAIKAER